MMNVNRLADDDPVCDLAVLGWAHTRNRDRKWLGAHGLAATGSARMARVRAPTNLPHAVRTP